MSAGRCLSPSLGSVYLGVDLILARLFPSEARWLQRLIPDLVLTSWSDTVLGLVRWGSCVHCWHWLLTLLLWNAICGYTWIPWAFLEVGTSVLSKGLQEKWEERGLQAENWRQARRRGDVFIRSRWEDAAYEWTHTHTHINIHIYTHAYAWLHNAYMHKHACMSMCMHTHMCTRTCMHTQFLP